MDNITRCAERERWVSPTFYLLTILISMMDSNKHLTIFSWFIKTMNIVTISCVLYFIASHIFNLYLNNLITFTAGMAIGYLALASFMAYTPHPILICIKLYNLGLRQPERLLSIFFNTYLLFICVGIAYFIITLLLDYKLSNTIIAVSGFCMGSILTNVYFDCASRRAASAERMVERGKRIDARIKAAKENSTFVERIT